VSNNGNHRVMKWIKGATEGIVVAGGQGQGNSLTQLSDPYGVVVDQLGTVYVADYTNQRVMRWPKGATQGSVVVGGNGGGGAANKFSGPLYVSVDRQGNLYVTDQCNHRVQKFNIEPSLNS
jgi:streptogramin lyase